MTARRRTKIVATLGPATECPEVLDSMIEAGLNVVRLNFSHGDAQTHIALAEKVRKRAAAYGKQIGVLADLQGPKIRISRFQTGSITLKEGDTFTLDAELDSNAGDDAQVGVDYKALPDDVERGDTLLLDDGRIVLRVDELIDRRICCRVVAGGILSNNKGINRQGGGLSAAALTDKDRQDIITAARMQADYLAVSFPRCAQDIEQARELLRAAGGDGAIVAKIERTEAVENIEDIIKAADVIMVARGDLGIEVGDAALPPIQKRLISLARRMNKVTITATQMMESMIFNPIPTRAEVFDVANAVLDGTDAVMLSGETAVGKHPIQTIAAMHRICLQAEQEREIRVSRHRIDSQFERIDEAIAMAAMYMANHLDVKAIAALTHSGATVLWMSRISSGIPIFAMTPNVSTARRVTLYRGVYPVLFNEERSNHALLNQEMVDELSRRDVVRDGDIVIVTKGDLEQQGNTNTLKLVHVGELADPTLSAD